MFPILFSIKGLNFYSYGLFASISVIAGIYVVWQLFQKEKLDQNNLVEKCLVVVFLGIVLSRLSYFFLYRDQFDHWYEVFYLWQGGLISFTGFLGGILSYCSIFRKKIWVSLDILALAGLVGIFFWRIGCTLAGDHPTIESNSVFSINGHLPVPLFESVSGLIGFIIFYLVYLKKFLKSGFLFWLAIGYYGIVRIIFDQWRIDPMFVGFRTGQIVGLTFLLMSVVAIASMIVYDKIKKG